MGCQSPSCGGDLSFVMVRPTDRTFVPFENRLDRIIGVNTMS
jgi:hypothetical protein